MYKCKAFPVLKLFYTCFEGVYVCMTNLNKVYI